MSLPATGKEGEQVWRRMDIMGEPFVAMQQAHSIASRHGSRTAPRRPRQAVAPLARWRGNRVRRLIPTDRCLGQERDGSVAREYISCSRDGQVGRIPLGRREGQGCLGLLAFGHGCGDHCRDRLGVTGLQVSPRDLLRCRGHCDDTDESRISRRPRLFGSWHSWSWTRPTKLRRRLGSRPFGSRCGSLRRRRNAGSSKNGRRRALGPMSFGTRSHGFLRCLDAGPIRRVRILDGHRRQRAASTLELAPKTRRPRAAWQAARRVTQAKRAIQRARPGHVRPDVHLNDGLGTVSVDGESVRIPNAAVTESTASSPLVCVAGRTSDCLADASGPPGHFGLPQAAPARARCPPGVDPRVPTPAGVRLSSTSRLNA